MLHKCRLPRGAFRFGEAFTCPDCRSEWVFGPGIVGAGTWKLLSVSFDESTDGDDRHERISGNRESSQHTESGGEG